jgi:hypothetical protein
MHRAEVQWQNYRSEIIGKTKSARQLIRATAISRRRASHRTWSIGQFHGGPRYTVRRLSRARRRPAEHVVPVWFTDDGYYVVVALGLTERAETIARASGSLSEMPSPLTAE